MSFSAAFLLSPLLTLLSLDYTRNRRDRLATFCDLPGNPWLRFLKKRILSQKLASHLTLVEGMIPAALFGEPNPVAEWQKYFGENSEPVADPSAYPPSLKCGRSIRNCERGT